MKIERLFGWMLAAVVIVLIVGLVLVAIDFANADNWTERGQRGDFWGGHIAAAGSMASVILLILTVAMQRVELHRQLEELEANRKEMEAGRQVHMSQRKQLERQAIIAEKSAQQIHIFDVLERRQSIYDQYQRFFNPDGTRISQLNTGNIGDKDTVIEYEQTEERLRNFDTYLEKTISISRLNNNEKSHIKILADLFPHEMRRQT